MTENLLHYSITEKIIQSFFTVNKNLPYGLPADAYGNALAIEFEQNNLKAEKDYSIELKYRKIKIGILRTDFLVDKKVLVKVVSVDSITKRILDDSKLMLKCSDHEVCMVLNSLGDNDYKRIIFTNDYKKNK